MYSSFLRAMGVLQQMSTGDRSKEVSDLLEPITETAKSFPECTSINTEDLIALQSALIERLDLSQDTCDLLTRAVTSICAVLDDREGDLVLIGVSWTSMGSLFMALLAPQGPVDPIVKNRTKLNIAKEQVYKCFKKYPSHVFSIVPVEIAK